jgi:protein-L-isoaspartate(D-aspartate) O-methyltransferase
MCVICAYGLIAISLITAASLCNQAGKTMNDRDKDPYYEQRRQMVNVQLAARDITNTKVLDAMAKVPRHRFVPTQYRNESYNDCPLSIGLGQTISQPYIVALMTQLAHIDSTSKVLEIGTGSGYQAAVLAALVNHVYTIEIVEPLCCRAESTLTQLGYSNVSVRCGDGYRGWPEAAPFDAVIVTAAPDHIPQPLIDQLKIGGRMVIPVGVHNQELLLITKTENGSATKAVIPVRFVPMTGEAEK